MNSKTLKIVTRAALFSGLVSAASAATYHWDPSADAGIQYGSGVWDTITPNVLLDGSSTNTTWVNTTGAYHAISFSSSVAGTTPGTVTVTMGSNITLEQINMGGSYNANVVIEGAGHTLNFHGGSALVSNNSGTRSVTVNAVIAGGNIQKTLQGTVVFSQNNTYSGTTTIGLGTLRIGGGGTTGTLGGGAVINSGALVFDRSNLYTVANVISGAGTLTQAGSGTTVLSAANTYTGRTTISNGTLQLGASDRIADTSAVTLSGGTLATGGFSETLGALTVSANSVIDFGAGASALVFADSSSISWTGTLTLLNFDIGTDSLRFGNSITALSLAQLEKISFGDYTAALNSEGFVVFSAIPEPSAYAALLGAGALVGCLARRQRRA